MTRPKIGRAERNESGVALVEFAFVLVLFVMLLWGVVSFGYAWSLKEQMVHAGQEGLRSAYIAQSANASDDTAKQNAAIDSARQKLQSMLGTDSNEPTTGGLHIETGNCAGGTTCVGTPVYQPCPTSTGGTEPNTKCMTITVTYNWHDKPKIAPLPGIFDFLPSTIHITVTGKVQ
jgi:Flp pilus assembly protein TadG